MPSVLVVDDHSLITQGLTFALRAENLDVHVSAEPDMTLVMALALVHQPVLALVDLQFGGAACEGMALIEPLSQTTPVLVLTGVTDRAVLGACLAAGAVGIASKAEHFDRLIDRIRAALRGEPVNSLREREDMIEAHRERKAGDARRLSSFASLSQRECEVLDHLASGMTAEVIADRICVSMPTVRTHIQAILRKLEVNTQLAAVARVRESGWTTPTSVS